MTKHGLSTGEAARGLGIDNKTVANWMKHPKLRPFFSKAALGEDGALLRTITEADFAILNTIRELTAGLPNNAKDWDAVAARLEMGYRSEQYPPQAAMIPTSIVPLTQAVETAVTRNERDNAFEIIRQKDDEISRLHQRIADIEHDKNEQIAQVQREKEAEKERILRELALLEAEKNRKIGELETIVKLYESGRLKPE